MFIMFTRSRPLGLLGFSSIFFLGVWEWVEVLFGLFLCLFSSCWLTPLLWVWSLWASGLFVRLRFCYCCIDRRFDQLIGIRVSRWVEVLWRCKGRDIAGFPHLRLFTPVLVWRILWYDGVCLAGSRLLGCSVFGLVSCWLSRCLWTGVQLTLWVPPMSGISTLCTFQRLCWLDICPL